MSKRIIVAVSTSSLAGQLHLNGILNRLGDADDVYLKVVRSRDLLTPTYVREAVKSGADGFIVSFPLEPNEKSAALETLAGFDIPTVLVTIQSNAFSNRSRNLAFVSNDNAEVGVIAARMLVQDTKRRTFAFIHARNQPWWSQERFASFSSALRERGVEAVEFDRPEDFIGLSGPIAVFAANDDIAHAVITLCRIHRLSVPEDVSVLGVDNDSAICENVHPTISTIQLDFVGEGALAADLLLKMMSKPVDRPVVRTVHAKPIVWRESLVTADGRSIFCERALAYIRKHALEPMRVDDVARHLKSSRRLLDLRMRETTGTTVGETIIELRLAEVRRLLSTTELSIDEIAAACGYANAGSLKNLFRKRYHLTMRAFRTANAIRRR